MDLVQAMANRGTKANRYREALEKIADPSRALSYYDELSVIQEIATEALKG